MVYGRFGEVAPPTGEGRFAPTWSGAAPTVTGTSIAGADYVDYPGSIIPIAAINAFLNT